MGYDYFNIGNESEASASIHNGSAERFLWAAVLLQAWCDVHNKKASYLSLSEKKEAFRFLKEKSHGFCCICAAAGVDADYMHEKMMDIFRKEGRVI